VQIAALTDGRNLDARDELDPGFGGCSGRFVNPVDGVVIRDGNDRQPGGLGRADEVRRRQAAVGRGGVEMKIDDGGKTRGRARRPACGVRNRCRRTQQPRR